MEIAKKVIFLVDDEPMNLFFGQAVLQDHFDVLSLRSGVGLMKALEKAMPDLILLDIDMPEMDGFETIRLLKNNPETVSIPVIFLTARTDDDSKATGLSLGAADYLLKPYDPPRLTECIEIALIVNHRGCIFVDGSVTHGQGYFLGRPCVTAQS